VQALLPHMSNRRISVLAVALALTATGPTLAAGARGNDLAAMDCAALGRETLAVRDAEFKLASAMTDPKAMSNPQRLLDQSSRLSERGAAIQKQKEAKRCPGAVIDNNDRGK